MDTIGAILIFVVFLQQTNFILGSYIIPNEVFKTIELISGSKNQYISLKDQKRYRVKDVIQHYFTELNTLKAKIQQSKIAVTKILLSLQSRASV